MREAMGDVGFRQIPDVRRTSGPPPPRDKCLSPEDALTDEQGASRHKPARYRAIVWRCSGVTIFIRRIMSALLVRVSFAKLFMAARRYS